MLKSIRKLFQKKQFNTKLTNENLNQSLPFFYSSKVKKEIKTGINKWKQKTIIIFDWFLLIFNKNTCEKILNLQNLNSIEKCNDLIEFDHSFILYINNEEIRFIVENNRLLEKWLTTLYLIKILRDIFLPFEKQKNFKKKYLLLLEWIEIKIINKQIILDKINLMQSNIKKINEKVDGITSILKMLQSWKFIILSRFCKYNLILTIFKKNKNNNNNNNNDNNNTEFDNNDEFDEDNYDEDEIINEIYNELLNNNQIKSEFIFYPENEITKINNNIETNFKNYQFYELIQKNSKILTIKDDNGNLKNIYSNKIEIIKPEIINLEIEFPILLKKKNVDFINSNNNNNNSNPNTETGNENFFKGFLTEEELEKEIQIKKQSRNFSENTNHNNKNSKMYRNNEQDLLFYSFFYLNNLERKKSIFLAQNCLNRWLKEINSLLYFPIDFSGSLYSTTKISHKSISWYAKLKSWILFLYNSSESDQPTKVLDLRTLKNINKIENNKENKIIMKFKDGLVEKFTTKNKDQLVEWIKNFNILLNFLTLFENNKDNHLNLIKCQTLFEWLITRINILENKKDTHINLFELYIGYDDQNEQSEIKKIINLVNKQLNHLNIWKKRIINKISKIQYILNQENNFNLLALSHTDNNTNNKDNNNNNNNNNNDNEEKIENYKLLKYKKYEWIFVKQLNPIFQNNETYKNIKKYFLGILNSNEGLVLKSNVNFIPKDLPIENYQFDFNKLITTISSQIQVEKTKEVYSKIEDSELNSITPKRKKSKSITQLKEEKIREKMQLKKMIQEHMELNKLAIFSIPVYKKGYLFAYKYGRVTSKWQKRYYILDRSKLKIYNNQNEIESIKIIHLNKNFEINVITKEELIPTTSNSIKNNSLKYNVFVLINNETKILFSCKNTSTKMSWINQFETLKNYLTIQRLPIKNNFNIQLRERQFHLSKNNLEEKIITLKNQMKALTSMYQLYYQNPNKKMEEINSIEIEIEENKLKIQELEKFQYKILKHLLRFKLNNLNINNYKNHWGYMIKNIKDNIQKIEINKNEWIEIISENNNNNNNHPNKNSSNNNNNNNNNDNNNDNNNNNNNNNNNTNDSNNNKIENGKSKIKYNGKELIIRNNSFIRVVPSKPEPFLEDVTKEIKKKEENEKEEQVLKEQELYSQFQTNSLLNILCEDQFRLAKAMIKIVNASDADVLGKSLVNLMEPGGLIMPLINHVIKMEVESISNENNLFRGNSIATKIMNAYTKGIGKVYFKLVIGPFIEQIVNNEMSFELSESRLAENESLEENKKGIEIMTTKIFDTILSSTTKCPLVLRDICWRLISQTEEKFPDSKYLLIAGFFFLRFICPIIVVPEMINLLNTKPSPRVRRSLVLVSKIIQNVANGTHFKENYMQFLNPFVDRLIPKIQIFMDSLTEPVYLSHTLEKQQELLLLEKVDNTFIACWGNYLTQDTFQINIDDLDLDDTKIDYQPEYYPITEEQVDLAILKIFKMLNIGVFRNKLFSELENETDLIDTIQKIIQK